MADVFGFDYHIIYICLDCFTDLFGETSLDHALVRSPSVFSPKRIVLKQNGP